MCFVPHQDDITALMEASIMGHKDIAQFLINKGAEVDAQAASGVTALWLAAGEGRDAIVQLLIGKVRRAGGGGGWW
jgi:uncharacterized protein